MRCNEFLETIRRESKQDDTCKKVLSRRARWEYIIFKNWLRAKYLGLKKKFKLFSEKG